MINEPKINNKDINVALVSFMLTLNKFQKQPSEAFCIKYCCNFIKNRLQQRCFRVKFTIFFRTPISKNICE